MFEYSNLQRIVLISYGIYLGALSLIAFVLYAADKRRAEKGAWRIPEATLLLFSFLGGAFGGYPAMLLFRHKTRGEHWYFTFVNVLGILLHGAAMALLVFYFKF